MSKPDPLSRLIFELSKLPGIGEKTAARLAYTIIKQDLSYAQALSQAVIDAKTQMRLCMSCFNLSEDELCSICQNSKRDDSLICVVEKPVDVTAIEQAGSFSGRYHVLQGVLSPLDGVGPEDLKIDQLIERVSQNSSQGPKEIILALNPSVEGEATSHYLVRLLRPFQIKISRIAAGLPAGAQIEYSDRQTIGKALINRVELS
jgi:recombination protein RecR